LIIRKKISDKVKESKWIKDMDQIINIDPNLSAIMPILEARVKNIEIIYHDRC